MTEQALKATPEGIKRANKAVLIFASIDLAVELKISRAVVRKFFAGKPVEPKNFHKICQKLELPWREIADLPLDTLSSPENSPALDSHDIDALVREVRDKVRAKIQQRCGTIRVLDMPVPIALKDIYTHVNILEKIIGRRRLLIGDLLKLCVPEEFERPGFGRITEDRVSGVEAIEKYSKLIILGKPGAGKTTFLKHVTWECISGALHLNLVPIFIALKDFDEAQKQPSLLEYISEQLSSYGVGNIAAKQVLSNGRALVLLDGLDEVREIDSDRVLKEVRHFANQFHLNHFVISCRIATREYTFEQFAEVEIADFDDSQIATFATQWFANKDPKQGNRFIEKLQTNSPIREIATNPLLLTLLCLVFEESADFPSNAAELYKEGLNVLLRKWDAKRNIDREQLYKKLSVQHKEDLLGQIALRTFERGDYFFSQKQVEQHIADYIRHLPGFSADVKGLQLDSCAVLKSIEVQHGLLVERARGIYSFSHLTFQEYFTAKEIVTNSAPQALERSLKQLVSHITEKRWREVFLLSAGMLRNADYLLQLMKQQIDELVATDQHIQRFLGWVNQKSLSVTTDCKSAIARSFYFDLDLTRTLDLVGSTLDLARALDLDLARNLALDFELALDRSLTRALALTCALALAFDRARALDRVIDLGRALNRTLDLASARAVDPNLERSLQQLKEQLSHPDEDPERFKQWWKAKGAVWSEQLRSVTIEYRNIGHNWLFSDRQRQVLKHYYDANQLLIDCLNNARYVTRAMRQEINETLLLPVTGIKILSA